MERATRTTHKISKEANNCATFLSGKQVLLAIRGLHGSAIRIILGKSQARLDSETRGHWDAARGTEQE